MDVQLGGMDGLTLTRQLSPDRAWSEAVIVVLTAYAMKGDEENALAAGCEAIYHETGQHADLGRGRPGPYPGRVASRLTWPMFCFRKPSMVYQEGFPVDRSISTVPILVIDDDADYRILLRHQLEGAGYQVLDSADGGSASAVIDEQGVQLVILDIVMPRIEGLEIIRQLRRQGCRSKILAVSGAGNAEHYLTVAVRLGADAMFEKARPVRDLLVAVERLIGLPGTLSADLRPC